MTQDTLSGKRPVPVVWIWFVVYTELMALLYAVLFVGGGVLFFIDASLLNMELLERNLLAGLLMIFGGVFLVPFAVAPLLPRRPWAWVVGIVLIAIGFTSGCTLPASLPLIIFWLRPETKRFYHCKE